MSGYDYHELSERYEHSPERARTALEMLLRRLAFEVEPSILIEGEPHPGLLRAQYSILVHGERKVLAVHQPFLLAYGRALGASSRARRKQQAALEETVREALVALLSEGGREVWIKDLNDISTFPRE